MMMMVMKMDQLRIFMRILMKILKDLGLERKFKIITVTTHNLERSRRPRFLESLKIFLN